MLVLTSDPVADPTKDMRVPEGFTVVELADYLSERNFVDKDEFEALCKIKIKNLSFRKCTDRKYPLEGYLYPDTYKIDVKWSRRKS